jgi:hypothetical protein
MNAFDKHTISHSEYLSILKNLLLNVYFKGQVTRDLVNRDYIKFAEIIDTTLKIKIVGESVVKIGAQMSSDTLKRLLRYNKQDFSKNTLDRLSIFLKYNSWLDFKQKQHAKRRMPEKYQSKIIRNVVREAIQYEVEAITALPYIDYKKLKKTYYKDELLRSNFSRLLRSYNTKGWKIVELHHNIDRFKIIYQNAFHAKVLVEETIYREWFDTNTQTTVFQDMTYAWIYILTNYSNFEMHLGAERFVNEYGDKVIKHKVSTSMYIHPDNINDEYVYEYHYEGWLIDSKIALTTDAYSDTQNYINSGISADRQERYWELGIG